jgi:hypothetical protein
MGYFDDVPFADGREAEQPAPAAAPAQAGGSAASPLYDVVRSLGTGVRTGIEAIPAMAGDLGRLVERGSEAIARPIFGDEQVDAVKAEREKTGGSNSVDRFFRQTLPTSQDVRAVTEQAIGPGYTPETTEGKFAKTVGEFLPTAAAPARSISGLGRSLLGSGVAPGVASEAAGQATEGTAAEPWARFLGGVGGGMAGGMATLERTPRTLKQGQRQDVLDAGARQGIEMPGYMMPDAPVAGQAASRMIDIPFLGGPVRAASERSARDIGDRTQELARQVGNPDMSNATFGGYDALRQFQTTASRDFKARLYNEVDQHITNPQATTPLRHTRTMVRQLLNEADADTVRSHQQAIDLVREAISRPGGLTYQGMKRLRTDIGSRSSGKITPEPGTNQPLLKRIYGALTDDLEQSVIDSGGQTALQAWREANRMTQALEEVSTAVSRVIGTKGQVTPQNAMKTIKHLATAEDPSVRNRLNLIQMAMDEARPGAFEDVGAALLSYIGRDPKNPAVFSPQKLVENYGKMSREGRVRLFGQDVADALDDLATLSRTHKDLTNPSKFGVPIGAGFGLGIGAGVVANPIAVISGAVGANMTARLLSRPATAQKIASWARAREGAGRVSPAAFIQASKALADAAAEETGADAGDLLDKLLNGGGEDVSAD